MSEPSVATTPTSFRRPEPHTRSLLLVIDTPDGGLGAVADRHAAWFTDRGWFVGVAGPRPGPHASVRPSHFVDTPATARDVRGLARAARQLRRAVDHVDPDVVHCHGPRAFVIALLAGVRGPCVTVHGTGPVPSDPAGYRHARSIALRLLPRLSRAAFSAAPELPDGWCFAPHASPRLPTLDRVQLPVSGPPTFLWLARLDEGRSTDVFIRAVAHLAATTEVRGVVAGGGPDAERLRSLSAALSAPIDFVGHADPGPLLAGCWGLVLLSSHEAVNFAVQEAMWVGRAVVASPLPGIVWLGGDLGLWAASVEDTVDALRRLCDRAEAEARGDASARRIRSRMDPDSPWPTIEAAYTS